MAKVQKDTKVITIFMYVYGLAVILSQHMQN